MARFLAIGVFACCIIGAIGVSGSESEKGRALPNGDGASTAPRERVTFKMVAEGGGAMRVEWIYPERLSAMFQAQPSRTSADTIGIKELRRQEAAGDRLSGYELGYFYLYGIGVEKDLAEAERRLRQGFELKRPEGAWRLADAIAREDGNKDWEKIGELTVAALRAGEARAIELALWVVDHALHWSSRRLRLAEEILKAAHRLQPAQGSILVRLARVHQMQGRADAAWEFATRALDAPELSSADRLFARLTRLQSAEKAGKVGELGISDVREVGSALGTRFRGRGMVFIAVGGVLIAVSLFAGLVLLTRAGGDRGPRLIWIIVWIAMSMTIVGVTIMLPISVAISTAAIALAAWLALVRDRRQRYFPMPTAAHKRTWLVGVMTVFGVLAAIQVAANVYEYVYRAVTGHPPDLQVVAAFLQANTPSDAMLLFVAAAILIPVYEEVIFRGFFHDWLEIRMGRWWALIVGACVFGLIHGLAMAFPVGALGLGAGWLRLRFGNLWAPIAVHGLMNGASIILLWYGFR